MNELLLGVIIGLLVALNVTVAVFRFRTPIERSIQQIRSKIQPKGRIIEDDPFLEELRDELGEK